MAIDGQVCFSQMAFYHPCQTTKVHYRDFGPVNGINKDVRGTSCSLLPTTVPTYPVDLVCFCPLLKRQHCYICVLMEGIEYF